MATMPITVNVEAAAVLRRFDRLPESARAAVRRNVARELLVMRSAVRSRADIRTPSGTRGLMGRLTSYASAKSGLGLDAAIGFRKTRGFPYELSQEFGARAKPGRAMSIPVSRMAKAVGSPRNMPGVRLFVPRGTHVLAEAPAPGRLVVHYVLVKSIRPRLNFRRTVGSPAASEKISAAIVNGLLEGSSS
jgi:hypothetical protein